ncbi:MAG: thiamine diphosphokinase [Ruminococcaceae bacterium]|nr:thiamine diphosphokinase [Oscillospiraceae bacterium]
MKAYIFTGGEIFHQYIEEKPEENDLVIAADSGYKNAALMGAHINILIGDFDSLGDVPDDVDEVFRLPEEKDVTDTQIAVDMAVERGADEIVIIGSTSGRLDHTLSTLAILEKYWEKRLPIYIVNGQNRVRYIRDSGFIVVRSQYKYFSVIAADEKVKGVSIEGGKYPLIKKTLLRNHQFAVSNEITKNCALITVKKGGIYIIESKDL